MSTMGDQDATGDDAFRRSLHRQSLAPLWDYLRAALPAGRPPAATVPHHWRYADVKPLLVEAGRRVPVEKAERRVLVLSDPGRNADALQATGTIYAGIQLLLPGEKAPTHRHTPSAARIVIEGDGGFTIVNGRKCPMQRGDLILTPSQEWHDHGHDGASDAPPVTWLDVLDLPLFTAAEAAYAEPGRADDNREDPLATLIAEIRMAGLAAAPTLSVPLPYPKVHFSWRDTRRALTSLARLVSPDTDGRNPIEVRYVNPHTGESCLPIMGFTAMLLAPGRALRSALRSSGAVFHVIEGAGRSRVDESTFEWAAGDTFSAPSFARIEHEVASHDEAAFLLRIDDEPLQRKLGFFAEKAIDRGKR